MDLLFLEYHREQEVRRALQRNARTANLKDHPPTCQPLRTACPEALKGRSSASCNGFRHPHRRLPGGCTCRSRSRRPRSRPRSTGPSIVRRTGRWQGRRSLRSASEIRGLRSRTMPAPTGCPGSRHQRVRPGTSARMPTRTHVSTILFML